jgi:hypothetical protein
MNIEKAYDHIKLLNLKSSLWYTVLMLIFGWGDMASLFTQNLDVMIT